MIQLIDTHAHIYTDDFQLELKKILQRAQENYVHKICMPNIDEETITSMMDIATIYPTYCFPMMGIHPCHITKNFTRQLYLVEGWLQKASFVAIGEIGIDLYHDTNLSMEQQEAFSIQLRLAKAYKLPVAIHCRNAFKEVLQILEKEQDGTLKGVMHCFSGNLTEAERCIELGLYLGIGGIITLPKSGLAETIRTIDLAHLVLETDSPYLTPAPYRGKRNEPAYLRYIAEKLAEVKGVICSEIASITTQNAERLFALSK